MKIPYIWEIASGQDFTKSDKRDEEMVSIFHLWQIQLLSRREDG